MNMKSLLKSSAFMMMLAMFVALVTNLGGWFPESLTPNIRSDLTIWTLVVMLTLSLSRIPYRNLNPVAHGTSVLRAVMLGLIISSIIPLIGYYILKDTDFGNQATGLIFVAAAPFAGSVVSLSYILRGDMEHAARGTIVTYVVSLVWIPAIIWFTLGESVEMTDVLITVLKLLGIPLIASRLLTKVKIDKDLMAIFLNLCIFFMVWLSVGATNFKGIPAWVFVVFALIAFLRSFGLGFAVERAEKRMGIGWSQRVTDILMASYKNKGIAIALCTSGILGPITGDAMVAIATSIIVEITWVAFMDSVLFSRKRMERELASEV